MYAIPLSLQRHHACIEVIQVANEVVSMRTMQRFVRPLCVGVCPPRPGWLGRF